MNNKRILSLDILRGADLFMLVGLQPVLYPLLSKSDWSFFNTTLLSQMDHVQWEGFSAWDLVMPLFLFMSGVTMPFSLPKYKQDNNCKKLWLRIIKRFLLLFFLGMVVQGNILSLNPDRIYLYSNTLQAIAVGYLLTVPMVLYLKPQTQIAVIAALLTVYTLPMALLGDWTPQGNFACVVDKLLLGRFRDGSYIAANGTWQFASWYDYTWIWRSLTFCCTVAMGSLAGVMIKNGNSNRQKTVIRMLLMGIMLIVAGEVWGIWHPIVKRIWSGSMTLYSGGWCYILLALSYWWIDVKGHKRGLQWLQYYGCNAIVAYLLGSIMNFRGVAGSLLHGLEQFTGEYYPILLTAGNSVIIFGILAFMYRHRIFLKV